MLSGRRDEPQSGNWTTKEHGRKRIPRVLCNVRFHASYRCIYRWTQYLSESRTYMIRSDFPAM